MALTAGIVGLPNVGKSTLFNAITNSKAEAANYPFATIDPNVGIVEVKDSRVDKLLEVFNSKKKIYTTFEFYDIAGLVKGASQGEGLGNKFLAHIREVDAICHLVRCFENSDITHVEGDVEPIRDIEIINLELIFADLQTIENRISKIERKAKSNDKAAIKELTVSKKIQETLLSNRPASALELSETELLIVKSFNLLTIKPVIYIANLSEDEISTYQTNKNYLKVKEYGAANNSEVLVICAKIEEELSDLDEASKKEFMSELGINESGLDKMIKTTYEILGLSTYLTAGPQEVRAWTFKNGMRAPECAGIIHTDFQRGFIKAEVYPFAALEQYGSESAIKENGKLRIEGKEYIMKDGDVVHFRFNV
ncbi:MAG: redox-regulated ATPase YchF [Erysipelotrichaceae bacterium]